MIAADWNREHSHIEWHVEAGLTAILIEAPDRLQGNLQIPADRKLPSPPLCPAPLLTVPLFLPFPYLSYYSITSKYNR